MSVQILNTLTDGTTAYQIQARLGDEDWLLDFVWNARRVTWAMSLATLAGTPCVTGQPVVCGLPLLARAVGGPAGAMIALSTDGTYDAPGLLELGDRVKLLFISSDDTILTT
jgi:hypothetical protein